MQFHHHGYVSGDPRVQPAAGVGIDRPDELPDEVDVLIVGTGPAGMIAAAQLSQFPGVTTRIVERRAGRLAIGQADGIQARSVETFQAFGFAGRIAEEAYRITEMCFWHPDPADPTRIVRGERTADDPAGISEFPHLLVNQARVLDYFAEFMANAPTRMAPDYGYEFRDLEIADGGEHPVDRAPRPHRGRATPGRRRSSAPSTSSGADGAHSGVRRSIGCTHGGRLRVPRLGRHGRPRRDRLPRHPPQVRDPVRRGRQHPAHPARGRPPVPHVRRPRRGPPADSTARCAARRSSRSSPRRTRSCTRTRST